MIRYQESNIKVIFHNISYNFLLIFQVKQSHPVGFSEHINLDYIYLLETSTYKVYVSSCMSGWPQRPQTQAFSLWISAHGTCRRNRLPCHLDQARPPGGPIYRENSIWSLFFHSSRKFSGNRVTKICCWWHYPKWEREGGQVKIWKQA